MRDRRYIARTVAHVSLKIVAAPSLLATVHRPGSIEELKRLPLSMLIDRKNGRPWPWVLAEGRTFLPTSPAFSCDAPETEREIVLAGIAFGQMPDYLAEPYLSEGRLVEVMQQEAPPPLRGAADKSASGFIRVFDLFNYVSEEVPKLIPDGQHPIFKADNLEVNFAVALSQGGKKSPYSPEITLAVQEELPRSELEKILVELYPFGPRDQEVWSRAGGDLSRLQFHPTGQAAWHAALRMLKQGGGGRSINFGSLLSTAKEDFSNHTQLAMLHA